MILTLYTTLGCHLCEQALGLLQQSQAQGRSMIIQEVEISDSDDLMMLYGIRIPVIKTDRADTELGWPFDAHGLTQFLDNIG
tara:strand:+ start:2987 stop:3232 length:246 start_codon:yes stop_codon:yes gene_type:complete